MGFVADVAYVSLLRAGVTHVLAGFFAFFAFFAIRSLTAGRDSRSTSDASGASKVRKPIHPAPRQDLDQFPARNTK
jgi:hypothetical protein